MTVPTGAEILFEFRLDNEYDYHDKEHTKTTSAVLECVFDFLAYSIISRKQTNTKGYHHEEIPFHFH